MFKMFSKVGRSAKNSSQKSDEFRCEGYLMGKASMLSHQLVNENKNIYSVLQKCRQPTISSATHFSSGRYLC